MLNNSVDSIVTDPPYGLAFMGKRWDYDVPSVEIWAECLRVLKPGGHLLAFAGTRTQHRMAVRIEDAGFEIRDMIAWVYGSGFPKSRDVSGSMNDYLAGDRASTAPSAITRPDVYRVTAFLREARDRAGWTNRQVDNLFGTNGMAGHWTTIGSQPSVPSVRQWEILKQHLGFGGELDGLVAELGATERPEDWGNGEGKGGKFLASMGDSLGSTQSWGTALKPALEPITVARKPLIGTVAQNVLAHGTGALNIDGCRVGSAVETWPASRSYQRQDPGSESKGTQATGAPPPGRWPANLIHDGSEEVLAGFPSSKSCSSPSSAKPEGRILGGARSQGAIYPGEEGSAARFFKQVTHDDEDLATMQRFMYCPKASKRDRDEGLEGFEAKPANSAYGDGLNTATKIRTVEQAEAGVQRDLRRNVHPTVKPTDLMAYLVRLVTPPGGLVLDPFMGSGSTGKAAMREGFNFIGCELSPEYLAIAEARIAHELAKRQKPEPPQPDLFAA